MSSETIQIAGNSSAPVIYFDIVSAHGVEGGVAIIEVVARTVVGTGGGQTRQEIVATAHLRTGLKGIESLKFAIDNIALAFAETQTEAVN